MLLAHLQQVCGSLISPFDAPGVAEGDELEQGALAGPGAAGYEEQIALRDFKARNIRQCFMAPS